MYEKIVGTAISVKSFPLDISSKSFWREEKNVNYHKIYIKLQHTNERNTMVEKSDLP